MVPQFTQSCTLPQRLFISPAPFSMSCKSRTRRRSNSYRRIITFDLRVIGICLNSSVRGCCLKLRTNRICFICYFSIFNYFFLLSFNGILWTFFCLLIACMQSEYHARKTNLRGRRERIVGTNVRRVLRIFLFNVISKRYKNSIFITKASAPAM